MTPSSPDRTAPGDELAHEGWLRDAKGFNDMTPTPTPTVDLDLDRLESAARAATPGPWFPDDSTGCEVAGNQDGDVDGDGRWIVTQDTVCNLDDGHRPDEDRAFLIAFNPATALSLIAALRASEAERERVKAKLSETLKRNIALNDGLTSVLMAHDEYEKSANHFDCVFADERAYTQAERDKAADRHADAVAELSLADAEARALLGHTAAALRTRPSGGDADGEVE